MENLKKNRKKTIFLTFRSGDSNLRFSEIFPPMIWIFMEDEGDEIKSKQASKSFQKYESDMFEQLVN